MDEQNSANTDEWIQYDLIEDHIIDDFKVRFTETDMKAIGTIRNEPNLFRLMTASLCEQICGHEMIKAALVLQLMSGVTKVIRHNSNSISIRGSIHALIVSEANQPKNVLLDAIVEMAPNSQCVYGNTCTAQTLTYNMTKHKNSYKLEQGFLLRADNGTCCIKSLESMNAIHHSLIEPMTHQTITLMKFGIVDKMSARVSILAATDSNSGSYDRLKTVAENVKSNVNLSLFDLVLVMIDEPNDESDMKHTEHTIANQSQLNHFCSQMDTTDDHSNNGNPLYSKLLFGRDEENPELIPRKLIKKYILYARQFINPVISDDAKRVIHEFGIEVRKNQMFRFDTNILESLYRLTEARARLELRNSATIEDASDVIDIFKYSMIDYNFDTHVNFGQINGRSGKCGKKKKLENLRDALNEAKQRNDNDLFTEQEIIKISQDWRIFIERNDVLVAITKLNEAGILLKKGNNTYQFKYE